MLPVPPRHQWRERATGRSCLIPPRRGPGVEAGDDPARSHRLALYHAADLLRDGVCLELFQTLLVAQLGWSFTDSAIAFSVAIFSLGTSAAWAGATLLRLGPRKLALAGSAMFSVGYLIAGLALHLDAILLFYLGTA